MCLTRSQGLSRARRYLSRDKPPQEKRRVLFRPGKSILNSLPIRPARRAACKRHQGISRQLLVSILISDKSASAFPPPTLSFRQLRHTLITLPRRRHAALELRYQNLISRRDDVLSLFQFLFPLPRGGYHVGKRGGNEMRDGGSAWCGNITTKSIYLGWIVPRQKAMDEQAHGDLFISVCKGIVKVHLKMYKMYKMRVLNTCEFSWNKDADMWKKWSRIVCSKSIILSLIL